MNRTLSQWIFGVVDDTARAALMLVLAGAALSLQEQDRRSGSQLPPPSDRRPKFDADPSVAWTYDRFHGLSSYVRR